MLIAVIGGSACSAHEAQLAEDVGRELAERGVGLVCGGMGGVMEAACRGAALAGGQTVGVLPGQSAREANRYVLVPIVTGMGYARNVIVVKSAGSVIAIGGGYGTLSEIAHALQNDIPVVGLNTWSFQRGRRKDMSVIRATSPVQAVKKAIAAAEKNSRLRTATAASPRKGDSGGKVEHH
ncbi:MAG: TIGR00725 family protein [Chloroflexi bacterium]|nr:TIGR00725 family protein [Chloroflexota bacterium]